MSDVYTVDLIGRNNADLYFPFQLTDDGTPPAPLNITGNTFRLTFIKVLQPGETPFSFTLTTALGTIPIVNGVTGDFALDLDYTIWAPWPVGKYTHDLIRTVGTRNSVVWKGSLNLKDGITDPPA